MMILALDASSTTIGAVLWDMDAQQVVAHRTIVLSPKRGSLAQRVQEAYRAVDTLIADAGDLAAISFEGPAHRTYPLALIAQQRVIGALLLVAAAYDLRTYEVPPTSAKKALTGNGNARKDLMERFAASYLDGAYDEHVADALGVALAADAMIRHEQLEATP